MSKAIQCIQEAFQRAEAGKPKVGGFPFLAEVLRQAGVTRNQWHLPSCQSIYETSAGPVVMQGQPLVTGMSEIPAFDSEALIRALRVDQAGESTFQEFISASWKAGVVSYDVDFLARKVSYYGVAGEAYVEEYPTVSV